jgi:hypothetical protein
MFALLLVSIDIDIEKRLVSVTRLVVLLAKVTRLVEEYFRLQRRLT